MANLKKLYPVKTASPCQKVISGRFTGINGATPTTYKLDSGVVLARSGEGVWTITLPPPAKNLKAFVAQFTDAAGAAHDLAWTWTAATRLITLTHRTAAYTTLGSVRAESRLADVSAADAATTNRAYTAANVAGIITKIQAQIVTGGPLNAAAVVTCNINGTPITTGAITLPDTSAVGTVVAVTPTAARTVAVGDILTGVTDAGGSTSAAVDVIYTIAPTSLAAEDLIDEINFIAVVEMSDVPGAGI